MDSALNQAIDQQELSVFYQPIFSLYDDKLLGFEALVRWTHPELGFISPEKFIPIAEETGLVIKVDNWVLREVCQQMATWQVDYPQHSPLTISVNISGQNFSQPTFVEYIRSILQSSGLQPDQLHLEITESTIMKYADSTVKMLADLKQMGVKLHIDDFGTGYSSLNYLHNFSLDAIKIDRSFISNMLKSESSSGLVYTIIKLAHMLNMTVIAEGVETDNQKSLLKNMQCEQAQGYYFAKPMDKTSLERLYMQKSTKKQAVPLK
jgi:EAL domain-containing protein (putative c-di-GMP-specific phosphodiesterase class I)